MSEVVKDFIKFIAEVIFLLAVFSIIFDPEKGIVSNTFNILNYAEPILLQNYLSSAIRTASYTPGNVSISIRTSGLPYIINMYKENDIMYLLIDMSEVNKNLLKTKFADLTPTTIISDCIISEQKVRFEKGITQTVTMEKIDCLNNPCKIRVCAGKTCSPPNC
jgi:hypothetical protein